MSYYKNNASANRDALFGGPPAPSSSSSSRQKRSDGGARASASARSSSRTSTTAASPPSLNLSSSTTSTRPNATFSGRSRNNTTPSLSAGLKADKMRQAEELRAKAKKAMTRGMFSKPDPIIAGTYYRQAADLYRACGENRLERLHRIASADCQRGQEAYAIAAAEYTRAAELVAQSDEKESRKRNESYQLHRNAADAWRNNNEPGRAAESAMKSGLGLLLGYDNEEDRLTVGVIDQKAVTAIEEAVEAHVPDPLNRFRAFRKCGVSEYRPDGDTPEARNAMKQLAVHNIVSSPYGYETVQRAVCALVQWQEYQSALYAAGAVTTLLEYENTATITLARAYLNETVLQLAMKDVVAADQTFLTKHLQRNSYLSSRECKLAEDLIRAVKATDYDALDQARHDNRAALANLDPVLRELVLNLQVSGVAKKKKAPPPPETHVPPIVEQTDGSADTKLEQETENNFDEMQNMMDEMGLGDDDIDNSNYHDNGNRQPEVHEELEDDEFDLR